MLEVQKGGSLRGLGEQGSKVPSARTLAHLL